MSPAETNSDTIALSGSNLLISTVGVDVAMIVWDYVHQPSVNELLPPFCKWCLALLSEDNDDIASA